MSRRSGRGRSVLAALAVLAGLPLASQVARAAEPRKLAVFGIDGFGFPKKVALAPVRFAALVTALLEKRGYGIVKPPLPAVDLAAALSCPTLDDACLTKIVAHLGADGLIMGEVRVDKKDGRVVLRVASGPPAGAARGYEDKIKLTLSPTEVDEALFKIALAFVDEVAEFLPPLPPVAVIVTPAGPGPDAALPVGPVGPDGAGVAATVAPPPRRRVSLPGLVLAGGGAALLGAGIPFGLRAAAAIREYRDAPDATLEDLSAKRDLARRARTSAFLADGLFAAGVVALGTGAVLFVLSLRAPKVDVEVRAALLRGGAGGELRLSWGANHR